MPRDHQILSVEISPHDLPQTDLSRLKILGAALGFRTVGEYKMYL